MSTDDRGVSAPLGIALLLAMVLAGMLVTIAVGATALDDTREQMDTDRAEKAMTQFDSKSAMVALGSTDHQGVSLADDGDGTYGVDADRGWMNVTIENTTSGDRTTVLNSTLGAVTYERGDTRLAYQGGGVWKTSGTGSTMVSPPEFHFRNATLTLPVIAVDGDRGLGTNVAVTKGGPTRTKYPNRTLDDNFTNPLTDGKVNVTVQSRYYEAWGRYFEQRTEGEVDYDHGNRTATVTLVVPVSGRKVTSAVAATASSGTLSLSGSGSSTARTDSYTSADGDGYSGDDHDGGNITVGGTVDIGGNACVIGSVRAGRRVNTHGNSNHCPDPYKVTQDVYYTTSHTVSSGEYGGELGRIDGIAADSDIDSVVDDHVDRIRGDANVNDNGDVSGGSLQFGADDTADLDAGRYYVDRFRVGDGETVEVDTSAGNVEIAVRQDVVMNGDASIDVSGDGQVKLYVKGEGTGRELYLDGTGSDAPRVTVPNQNSTQLWLYGKSDLSGELTGSSENVRFEGVIYAPGGESGTGHVSVAKADIYGGLVASQVDVSQGGAFHYDRALENERAVDPNEKVVAITYLHVSVNEVEVTGN